MNISDLFGNGQERVPAPEVADPEDVEQYNIRYAKANGISYADNGDADDLMTSNPFAKQEDNEYRSEFPWLQDPDKGVRWDFNPIELRNLAQPNTWVGMLVQSIVTQIAQVPITVVKTESVTDIQKRLSDEPQERTPIEKADTTEELPDRQAREIFDLLEDPNPDISYQDFAEMSLADLLEVGSASTVKVFPSGAYEQRETRGTRQKGDLEFVADPADVKPQALQVQPPEVWTKEYSERTNLLKGFWQFDQHKSPGGDGGVSRGTQPAIYFDSEEVMWQDIHKRSNRRYGFPPTLWCREFLRLLDLSVSQEQKYFAEGSLPNGFLAGESWDANDAENILGRMSDAKGNPQKIPILYGDGGDVDYIPAQFNYQELQFTERMQWYARVIASVFQVPTAVVGIEPEQINYHTFQGEVENFESNTLGPYMQLFERWVNSELIRPHWGREYHVELKPGVSESTRAMRSERVRAEFNAGLKTRNEARREIGDELVDEEQDGFVDEVMDDGDDEEGGLDELLASGGDSGNVNAAVKQTLEDIDTTPPQDVQEAAQAALDAREETGNPNDCGTQVGWQRANQLANGESVSEETINRMVSFLSRHLGQAPDDLSTLPRDSCQRMMIQAWGGRPGLRWAESVQERFETVRADSVTKDDDDDAFRNTDDFQAFTVQPGMVEAVADEISAEVEALYDDILSDAEIQSIIERLATPDEEGMDKSAAALARRLKELVADSDVVNRIRESIRDATAEGAVAGLERAISETGEDTDLDAERIEAQLRDRDVTFADRFVERMSEQVRETVADGWADGKGSTEIAEDIAEQANIDEGWLGAERIARQEMQVAAGQARSEFAADIGKVEVWMHSGDYPQRPGARESHDEMDGAWKWPGDSWEVDYSAEGGPVVNESVPGDSVHGIGCRCDVLLRDRDEVNAEDYAGDSSP